MATKDKAGGAIPGITPGSRAYNRRFWDDPFVEPKQQHRFGIIMPVYMNVGADDTSQVAERYNDIAESAAQTSLHNDKKTKAMTTEAKPGGFSRSKRKGPGAKAKDDKLDSADLVSMSSESNTESAEKAFELSILHEKKIEEKAAEGYKVGPHNNYYQSKGADDGTGGLYLRVSEYVGYSFTPPGITFQQGFKQRGGISIPDPDSKEYQVSDAKFSFVTTLRDDFHWSINFLFAIAAYRPESSAITAPTYLFPPNVVTGDTPKTLVVKEYSARQDSKQSKYKKGTTPFDTAKKALNTPPRVVGLHKFNNPVIKTATFDPFAYNGTELIKVTLAISFGDEGQENWYSYEATTGRYGRNYFTWKDDTSENSHLVENFDKARRKGVKEYPNWWTWDTRRADEDASDIRVRMLKDSWKPTIERKNLITERMQEGNPTKINELVSKSIQTLLDEKAAAEAEAAEEQLYLDCLANQTPSFEDQADLEADATRRRLQEPGTPTFVPDSEEQRTRRAEQHREETWGNSARNRYEREKARRRAQGLPVPGDPVE